ncbi:hypothetical protein A6R68_03281, partial [Neotoma lepida]
MSSGSEGAHSLQYLDIIVSQPGLREPWYIFVGYVDDTQFVHFYGNAQSQRMEPRVPLMEQISPNRWEQETLGVNKHKARELLQVAIHEHNQSQNRYSGHAYKGQDYVALNQDLKTWRVTNSEPQITLQKWKNSVAAEFLGLTLRWNPLKAHVTHHPRPRGCHPEVLGSGLLSFRDHPDLVEIWGKPESGHGAGGDQTCRGWNFPDVGSCETLQPTIPIVGISAGLIFLGVVVTGAVAAIVMRKKRSR